MGDTAGVSCLFNIFQHFGSKRRKAKSVGCGYVFFNKKEVLRKRMRQKGTGEKRQRGGERSESLEADRGKSMEGVENLPGSVSQGNRDSFNSAYIFILNDRYPRAGKAGKGQRQRGLERPGPDETHHGATEFNISGRLFSSWRGFISFQQR